MKKPYLLFILLFFVLAATAIPFNTVLAAEPLAQPPLLSTIRQIVFPAVGNVTFREDFAEPRGTNRTHEGNDIIGPKLTPLVAVTDGVISFLTEQQASWGYSLSILDQDGYEYNYLHINNDTPGTDDGQAASSYAFAPGLQLGQKVKAGQFIAWMGDSGNAEQTVPHLHFEIRAPGNIAISPYQSLVAATKVDKQTLPQAAFNFPAQTQTQAVKPVDQAIALPQQSTSVKLLQTPVEQVVSAQKKIDQAVIKKPTILKKSVVTETKPKQPVKSVVKPKLATKQPVTKTK